jgi:hypothetical protein
VYSLDSVGRRGACTESRSQCMACHPAHIIVRTRNWCLSMGLPASHLLVVGSDLLVSLDSLVYVGRVGDFE